VGSPKDPIHRRVFTGLYRDSLVLQEPMNLGRAEAAFAIAEPALPASIDATLAGPSSSSCGSVSDYS